MQCSHDLALAAFATTLLSWLLSLILLIILLLVADNLRTKGILFEEWVIDAHRSQ